MQTKSFEQINETYDLEIDKAIKTIKKQKPKKILLQFPEGLKPYAQSIVDELKQRANKEKINPEFFIWMSTCYGACDLPTETEKLGIDLIIHFGHSRWNYKNKNNIKPLK